jgi:hypothetical protein
VTVAVIGPTLHDEALWVWRKVEALKLRKCLLTETTEHSDVVLEVELRDSGDRHHGRIVKIPKDQPEVVQGWRVKLLEEVLVYVSVKEREEPGSFREEGAK